MFPYHYWWIAALLVLVMELLTGTVFLLIVCGAFLVAGLASWLGSGEIMATIIGAISGSIGVIVLRRYQRDRTLAQPLSADLNQGQLVVLLSRNGNVGRVRYRGTEWDAILLDSKLSAGDVGYIAGHENNYLLISSHPMGTV
jgi:membrane protein implicated in regulation of membrane protease activity